MTPHDLNKRLAEIIGMDLILSEYEDGFQYWQTTCEGEVGGEWDPRHDPVQMEIVKAWLREQGYGYEVTWFPAQLHHRATIWHYVGKPFMANDGSNVVKRDQSELIAMAQAICAAIPKENSNT